MELRKKLSKFHVYRDSITDDIEYPKNYHVVHDRLTNNQFQLVTNQRNRGTMNQSTGNTDDLDKIMPHQTNNVPITPANTTLQDNNRNDTMAAALVQLTAQLVSMNVAMQTQTNVLQ